MSNCVDILTPAVHFSGHDMDLKAYRDFLDGIPDWTWKSVPSYPFESEEQSLQVMGWWYLKYNTDWHADGVVIRFGRGRSSHTWRDLKGTLITLQRFMRRDKHKVMQARDESDGMRSTFRLEIVVGPSKADVIG